MEFQGYHKPRIVVAGVGGAGTNALSRMIEAGLSGVEFVGLNTDAQSLQNLPANYVIPIGSVRTRGMGAGGVCQVGWEAAEETADDIAAVLQGADLVFVAAGMGGGTGTGAAPVVARIARELGILTIAVVSTPFLFEGTQRRKNAEWGLKQLEEILDTVLVVHNQALVVKCDPLVGLESAFYLADDTLMKGVSGISDLLTIPGEINLGFMDIHRVLSGEGLAIWGVGLESGKDAGLRAAEKALYSPFMDDRRVDGCKSLLINVTGGEDLNFMEAAEVAQFITKKVHPDAEIFFGTAIRPGYSGTIKVTVIGKGATWVRSKVANTLPQIKTIDELLAKRDFGALTLDEMRSLEVPTIVRMRLHN